MERDDRIQDMLTDYHLDLLPPDEAAEVERHLRGCEACRRELEEISRTLDLLPFGLPPAEPPATLKGRVLAAIHDEPRAETTAPPPNAEPPQRPPTLVPEPTPMPPRREAVPAGGGAAPRPWTGWLAAAAAALLFALSGLAYLDLRADNQALQAEVRELRERQQGQPAQQDLLVAAVEGTERAPGSRGTAVIDPSGGNVALDVYSLPAPPEGHSYQVWLVEPGGETVGMGEMRTDDKGDGRMTGELPEGNFAAVEITTEPEGSEGQSGPVYLQADLTT